MVGPSSSRFVGDQNDRRWQVFGLYRSRLPDPGLGLAQNKKGRRETTFFSSACAAPAQLDMTFRPALRFLTGPFPPGLFAARFLAAVILPPLLLFFTILITPFKSRRLQEWRQLSIESFGSLIGFGFGGSADDG